MSDLTGISAITTTKPLLTSQIEASIEIPSMSLERLTTENKIVEEGMALSFEIRNQLEIHLAALPLTREI